MPKHQRLIRLRRSRSQLQRHTGEAEMSRLKVSRCINYSTASHLGFQVKSNPSHRFAPLLRVSGGGPPLRESVIVTRKHRPVVCENRVNTSRSRKCRQWKEQCLLGRKRLMCACTRTLATVQQTQMACW